MGSVWAVVVAAGSGTRFGGHKQLALVDGETVVALAVSSVAPSVDGIALVLPEEMVASGDPLSAIGLDETAISSLPTTPELHCVSGRSSRAGSVRAGLEIVPPGCDVVVVHDAARPLASPELCSRIVAAVRNGADGAIPGLPLTDTVKRTVDGKVLETLDRSELVAVQTPQGFSSEMLRRAHAGEPEATDDAALIESLGGTVVVLPGELANFKITSPVDLELARWWHARERSGCEQIPDAEQDR